MMRACACARACARQARLRLPAELRGDEGRRLAPQWRRRDALALLLSREARTYRRSITSALILALTLTLASTSTATPTLTTEPDPSPDLDSDQGVRRVGA